MAKRVARKSDPVLALVAGGDMRVRSLLVTVFEDLILPRGGEISITALQKILSLIGLEAGAVRTAVSRLVQEGMLTRRREGRTSFCRLSPEQAARDADGVRRVYAASGRTSGANWMLAHLDDHDRDRHGDAMRAAGFVSPARGVFLWPLSRPVPQDVVPETAIVMRGTLILSGEHRRALCPPGIDMAYRRLTQDIEIVLDRIAREPLTQERAMALRLIVVHRWQGLLLSHPELTREIEPPDWPGERTRAAVAALYRAVLNQSEAWLTANVPEAAGVAWEDLPTRF